MSVAEINVVGAVSAEDSSRRHKPAGLVTLAYRSRAVQDFSELQLHDLLKSAQIQNRQRGITGLLVYDEGKFFQWIEGDADNLEKVWSAIKRDPRHTDIELMGHQPVPLRFFADWDMRLSVRGSDAFNDFEVSRASPNLIDSLFRQPQAAAELMASLSPLAADMRAQRIHARYEVPSTHTFKAAPTLRDVIETIVVPQLIARCNPHRELVLPVDLRVGELVHQLTLADPQSAHQLIEAFYAETHSLRQLCRNLIEPAARGLGDLWSADGCDEVDVTIGMARLQSEMRNISADVVPSKSVGSPAVLVVPQPGELHLLGAALDSEALHQQGWAPRTEFPNSDKALQDMVSHTWFDALDLTLSTAFTREHWLPRVAETIARVRSASRNPALVIIVGGRGFTDLGQAARRVGANAGSGTSCDVAPLILQSLHKLR